MAENLFEEGIKYSQKMVKSDPDTIVPLPSTVNQENVLSFIKGFAFNRWYVNKTKAKTFPYKMGFSYFKDRIPENFENALILYWKNHLKFTTLPYHKSNLSGNYIRLEVSTGIDMEHLVDNISTGSINSEQIKYSLNDRVQEKVKKIQKDKSRKTRRSVPVVDNQLLSKNLGIGDFGEGSVEEGDERVTIFANGFTIDTYSKHVKAIMVALYN